MLPILQKIFHRPHKMLPIDVDSRFESASLHETVDYLCDFTCTTISLLIPFDHLRERGNHTIPFDFEGTAYSQIDGLATNSPLGPTPANVFLDDRKEAGWSNLQTDFVQTIFLFLLKLCFANLSSFLIPLISIFQLLIKKRPITVPIF